MAQMTKNKQYTGNLHKLNKWVSPTCSMSLTFQKSLDPGVFCSRFRRLIVVLINFILIHNAKGGTGALRAWQSLVRAVAASSTHVTKHACHPTTGQPLISMERKTMYAFRKQEGENRTKGCTQSPEKRTVTLNPPLPQQSPSCENSLWVYCKLCLSSDSETITFS